ncbi:MAG: glycosyltransferase family 1 protein, partial [Actinomycetota bacterium]
YTAERIRDRFGVSADRLVVVAQGLDPIRPGVHDPDLDRALRSAYGRYLLLPAIAYPHKRHADLVRALAALGDVPDLAVVITGRPGPETTAIERLAAALGLADRVHQLGRVPEDRLDGLYRSATATVFPSEYEGFGNPVLEAMARGCPVITSDATALPELVGEAGLVVPVGDTDALAAAVRQVVDDPTLRARLAAAGPRRAADFSAPAAGERLIDAYRRALAIG